MRCNYIFESYEVKNDIIIYTIFMISYRTLNMSKPDLQNYLFSNMNDIHN